MLRELYIVFFIVFGASADIWIKPVSNRVFSPEIDSLLEPVEEDANIQPQHTRNCFFTPVQCMLPLTDLHKEVQSIHGVYQHGQVRRSVMKSPWGYTDLMTTKRNGEDRFYNWLTRI